MAEHPLPEQRIAQIRERLLTWFGSHARDLPWRRTRDPYAILVSEVMLQQTQVDRVIPYYERFLARYPNVESLALAPTAEVIRDWSGLGYNRRAVNLQRAAQAVVERYGGEFPREPSALRSLPGIGPYTAGAIAAFAFEDDAAFLDTNMRRVITRVVLGNSPATEAEVLQVAAQLLPSGKSWEWNQALIEFGALQCTARRPACIVCPLRDACLAGPSLQTGAITPRSTRRGKTDAPFSSSSRYFRGRVVEVLRGIPESDAAGIELMDLGPRVREDFSAEHLPWLTSLVQGLERDGLAVIAEASPEYDAAPAERESLRRVRLP